MEPILEEKEGKTEELIRLDGISKEYRLDGKSFFAVKDVSLSFPSKGMVAILGPSGCGKTTLLNLMAGLDRQTAGELIIDGVDSAQFKQKDWDVYRNSKIGFVFQNYNLVNYRNVIHNVELPLELAGVKRSERKERALAALKVVGLEESAKKKVSQLSGGQLQRIAIARAIVNEPSFILADEPTGALDSQSSKLVLDVLKKISSDRLVVLVTHNEELALAYADRILRMKDGEIVSDAVNSPATPLIYKDIEPLSPIEKKKRGHLSTGSIFASCFENLAHKKTRTALTALACSFGILGVALVLAINNGFSVYVDSVERSVASSVPITLSPVTTRTHYENYELPEQYPDEEIVNVYDSRKSFTETTYNNFSNEYFSYLDAIMDDKDCPAYGSAMSVMYYRKSLNYHFLKKDPSGTVREINQYTTANSSSYTIASLTSLPGTILHEMYGDEGNMTSLYDTIAGKFPTQANELALILDSYNRIDFSTMKALGFYESDATLSDDNKTLTFSDMLGAEYKCYTNSSYYGFSSVDELESQVVERSDWDAYSKLSVQIDYDEETKAYTAEVKDDSGDNHKKTCRSFVAPKASEVYEDDAKHKPISCKIVGILRPVKGSYLQLMPSSLAYTPALSKLMVEDQQTEVTKKLAEYQQNNWFIPYNGNDRWSIDGKDKLQKAFDSLASAITTMKNGGTTDDATADLSTFKDQLNSAFYYVLLDKRTAKAGKVSDSYTSGASYFLSLCKNYGTEFSTLNFQAMIGELVLNNSITFNNDFFDGVGENNIIDCLASLNSYALVDSILIFPTSLTSKTTLKAYLDAWNTTHPDSRNDYIDIMSDFTGQLGTLVQLISIILVIFASVSLIVSSIMTAIITYVSVVERTKEIGILRSCGAKKLDIGRLFESECVFIGLVAGCLGIVFTMIACVPLNSVLNNLFPSNNLGEIAKLNPLHALILVAVSILLAFLSGLIPSQIAAKKDPVICLRSE